MGFEENLAASHAHRVSQAQAWAASRGGGNFSKNRKGFRAFRMPSEGSADVSVTDTGLSVRMNWNGAQLLTWTEEATQAGLTAAAAELKKIVQQMLSVPNIGVRKQRVRDTSKQGGGVKGTQYTTYPHSSRPGEPLRRRTGFGQKHVVASGSLRAVGRQSGIRTGYAGGATYMLMHELGIRYASGRQQRPVLVPALANNIVRLSSIYYVVAETFRPPPFTWGKDVYGGSGMGKP